MREYDALIVLSGGILGENELSPWTKSRVDKALELKNFADYLIFTTGNSPYIPPILDPRGFPVTEAKAMSNYCLMNGGERERILLEERSTDTIGNAYFTRVLHTDIMQLANLGIVTSKFHMPRSKEVFKFMYNLEPLQFQYDLDFLEVEDFGMDERAIKSRKEKEAKSLEIFLKSMRGIKSLHEFHKWINTKHKSYSAGLKDDFLNGAVARTYR